MTWNFLKRIEVAQPCGAAPAAKRRDVQDDAKALQAREIEGGFGADLPALSLMVELIRMRPAGRQAALNRLRPAALRALERLSTELFERRRVNTPTAVDIEPTRGRTSARRSDDDA